MTQLTLDSALAQRDEAMSRVAANAGEGFVEAAAAHILKRLAEWGEMSGEHLTTTCKAQGIIPHDDRAFGPVYLRLARQGKIKPVGTCTRVRGHGTSGGRIWALTEYKD
jgi:hypothetical protein